MVHGPTSVWIEQQLHDPDSRFYLGKQAEEYLSPSGNYTELIDRLSEDSLNLHYAAAYLAMIERLWGETLKAPWFTHRSWSFLKGSHNGDSDKGTSAGGLQNSRTGIIATLYSLGLVRPDGSLRMPHDQPLMNNFGRTAQGFFDSFLLRGEFP